MRLNVIAFGVTAGLVWGLAVLIVAAANLIWPPYGGAFLDLVGSIYPGFQPGAGVGSVVTGTLYGLVDGGIAGIVFAWIYNLLSGSSSDAGA